MNATQQAKNGLKTFIITFFGSLLIFGSFYYFLLEASSTDVNVEESANIVEQAPLTGEPAQFEQPTYLQETLPVSEESMGGEPEDVMGATAVNETENATGASPFAYLAAQEVNVGQRAVLADADTSEATQSTVPSTGLTSVTVGFVVSIALFSFFLYMIFLNPRRYALAKFEKTVVKDLEK